MRIVDISGRKVGPGHPCFIVAEAGSNHNGSYDSALKLIDAARTAGVDAVKFQTFRADKLYPKKGGTADYLKTDKPIYEIIREMEMPYEWIPKLAAYCRQKGVLFFSAPFDEHSVDVLEPHVPVFKVASYESTHLPLLRHIARKGKPIILSTGATTLEEIDEAIATIRAEGNEDIILMNCVAAYPAPVEDSNLLTIPALQQRLGIPVGISDHTRDHRVVPIASVAVGGNIIEKTFTLSNRLPGPDHAYSVEPPELAEMVRLMRDAQKALGDGKKRIMPSEKELRDFARRSVLSIRDIQKGEAFSRENIAVLRQGKIPRGAHPRYFEKLLGRKARRGIPAWTGIQESDG